MNAENNKVNELQTLCLELRTSIDKLKNEAKEKYNKNKNETEDQYELAYARGYYFGQLASLGDCFNFFELFLATIQKNNKISSDILRQQVAVMVKIVEDISVKIKSGESVAEFINSIENILSLIKGNLER